ncbi:MAG TPA: N-acetylmuramic acid 6-phosphate etherase [Candidatus Cybelea sp.]|jgi:N-acetylmuramic acid 6-phosphate etherase
MTDLPPTERENPQSAGLDLLSTPELVEVIVADQRSAVDAAFAQTPQIARTIDSIAQRLADGGHLHYVGAGSSGRIAMLDASEMPPTFGTESELVQAHVAGGAAALVRSMEGAEDDAQAGAAVVRDFVRSGDAVIGLSASGSAAYVVTAVERSNALGALTIAVTSVADSPLARAAGIAIVLETGAEVLAGSTRLKAGTAQKIVLNAISTGVMIRLGKVYDNLMVDVVASNRKLHGRALRLIEQLARVDERRARELLAAAGGRVKVAVVMERRQVDAAHARALLERHDGALRPLLQ